MERRTVVAVDLGATHYRTGLVAEDGSIVRLEVGYTPRVGESGLAVTRAVEDAVEAVIGDASPAAIGIASAGPLDCAAGLVVRSPNMVFPEVPLRKPLEECFDLPVFLLNDCRAGALGERWQGVGQGVENLVYVTLSTGIGGGAVVNGLLLLGRSGNAGEVGHLFVDGGYGCVCGCGHPGHWEAYASGTGMPRFFAAWLEEQGSAPSFDAATSAGILGAAERGDPLALSFMDALGRVNARALSDIVVAYEPEVVVLDGPLAQHHGDLLIRSLLPHLDRYLPLPRIAVSPLGGRAPLLGAAAYALGIF
jgi:glucokinase